MSILEKINVNKKILLEFAEENEQYKEFVDAILKFLYKDNENVVARFSIGKKIKEGFLSFLDSYTEKLRVLMNTDDVEPMVIFKDGYNPICAINLMAIHNVEIVKEECESFTRYVTHFDYKTDEVDLDYCMNFLIYN